MTPERLVSDEEIRSRLRRRVIHLRVASRARPGSNPRFVETDLYRYRDDVYRRLRVILRNRGCCRPFCTMCPLPNEGTRWAGSGQPELDATAQFRIALNANAGAEMICIYNDGSFFADGELLPAIRSRILSMVRMSRAKHCIVESLPEFLTASSVAEAIRDLGSSVGLTVAIGLQSADAFVRETCVATTVTEQSFLDGIAVLKQAGAEVKVYLMFKPPFLSEEEAISDCIYSVRRVRELDVQDITLCPTRVAPRTVACDLMRLGLFIPPALRSIVRALRLLHAEGLRARVSLFNVQSSDFPSVTPRACVVCNDSILSALQAYNRDPKADAPLQTECSSCSLKPPLEDQSFFELGLRERILSYLEGVGA